MTQADAFARLKQVLGEYDLSSLADWVWDQVVQGRSEAEILQALRETPEFRTRFRAIEERRQLGLPALSPREVIEYERAARETLRALPAGFYDSPDDFVDLLVKDVSIRELQSRVNNAYVRVAMAPAAIRDAFARYTGAGADDALAAFILDPDRAEPLIMEQVVKAEVGGTAATFGFTLEEDRVTELAKAGVDRERATSGFAQLGELQPLFTEGITETDDIEAVDEGADAVFGLGGDGAQRLQRRRQERQAATSGGGGAAQTQTQTGLGRAY